MPKNESYFHQFFNPAALKAGAAHGNAQVFLKIDGAANTGNASVAKLLGHPPGYVPFDNTRSQLSLRKGFR